MFDYYNNDNDTDNDNKENNNNPATVWSTGRQSDRRILISRVKKWSNKIRTHKGSMRACVCSR